MEPLRSMIECELWVDIECKTEDGQREVVCTVFARQSLPVRPLIGEALSFHPAKGSKHSFNVAMSWGSMPASGASVEIQEISHYRGPLIEAEGFKTSLRCSPVAVPSIEDAKSLVAYLSSQHGFEIDPYGVNRLYGGKSAT
jgi:hypothetical protein